MNNISIIKGVKMKRFIIFIFIASLLFAVKPVPRAKKKDDDKKSKVKIETVVERKNEEKNDNKDKKEKEKDHFKDADSNSVNDQREDDLQKIKLLKTKHKDLLKGLKGLFNKTEDIKKPKKKSRKKK